MTSSPSNTVTLWQEEGTNRADPGGDFHVQLDDHKLVPFRFLSFFNGKLQNGTNINFIDLSDTVRSNGALRGIPE